MISKKKKKNGYYFVSLTHGEIVYEGLQVNEISTMIDKYRILITQYNFHDVVKFILPNSMHIRAYVPKTFVTSEVNRQNIILLYHNCFLLIETSNLTRNKSG